LGGDHLPSLFSLASTRETVDYLSQTYERNLALLKQNAVSPQKVDELKNQLTIKKNELTALLANMDGISAQLDAIDASIETVKLTLSRLSVVSPVDGLVENIFYKQGEFAPPLSPIVELVDLRTIRAKVYVDELTLAQVKPGQKVDVKTALSQLEGHVVKLPQRAEFSPREVRTPENRRSLVYAVEIEIDNPDYVIKTGMPLEVHF
jgi:HlyD family secretion protein